MERSTKIVLFLCIIIFVLAGITFKLLFFTETPQQTFTGVSVPITYANFEAEIEKQSLVQDLPAEAAIQLQFYNFNTGNRAIEQSYRLTQDKVEKGAVENPDIIISLHAKYLAELTNQNFCSIVTQANENGDLDVETKISSTAFAWKYKSMLKYKECLGF